MRVSVYIKSEDDGKMSVFYVYSVLLRVRPDPFLFNK